MSQQHKMQSIHPAQLEDSTVSPCDRRSAAGVISRDKTYMPQQMMSSTQPPPRRLISGEAFASIAVFGFCEEKSMVSDLRLMIAEGQVGMLSTHRLLSVDALLGLGWFGCHWGSRLGLAHLGRHVLDVIK